MKTIPVTLASLVGGGQNINFGLLMAGSTVTTLPILLIFLILQKYLIAGFACGRARVIEAIMPAITIKTNSTRRIL